MSTNKPWRGANFIIRPRAHICLATPLNFLSIGCDFTRWGVDGDRKRVSPRIRQFVGIARGVHPPWGHDAFPPLFQISPYFREIFGLWGKFSKLYLFLKNFLIFIRRNFWWPFLVIDHKFRISPLFSLFHYIFPLFRENYYFPPTLTNIHLCFTRIHLLFTYFTCISFPPTFTMMHLCITQCTYWTPLGIVYFVTPAVGLRRSTGSLLQHLGPAAEKAR